MFKIVLILAVVAGGSLLYAKHLLYERGVRDAEARHAAMAAERTLDSKARQDRALRVSALEAERAKTQIELFRKKAEMAAAEAMAARHEAAAEIRPMVGEKMECPRQPDVCASDLRLRQP